MAVPASVAETVNPALAAAIANFHARTPPRIWSLIVSFIGDAVLPRGGAVQAGVISEFCALAGIEPGLVRTALSRLVAKGILARQRDGRKSFYRLTAAETLAFEAAADLIYGRALPAPDGRWDIVLIDAALDRAAARAAVEAAVFASTGPTSFIRPHHPGRLTVTGPGLVTLTGVAEGVPVDDLWPLDDLAASYRRFMTRYAPLADETSLSAAEAVLARVLLVHDFRRIVLRDPFLPETALPGDWPAAAARTLFDAAHRALTPAATTWLDPVLGAD